MKWENTDLPSPGAFSLESKIGFQHRTRSNGHRLRRIGTLKFRIFGHPRFLLHGLGGAQTEVSLGTMAYNLKRMMKVLGGSRLVQAITPA